MKRITILTLLLSVFMFTSAENGTKSNEKPHRIIFLIGDGMGLSSVSTTFYFGDQPSVFTRFSEIGMIRTSSATHKITDSAASGTAMSSGTKTYNGAIGLDTAFMPVKNITEIVSELGWSTGVVATSTISHATPASFYAHARNRSMEELIASQLLISEIDFFAGGGSQLFTHRKDSIDLIAIGAEKGFEINTTGLAEPGSLDPDQKYGFLLAPGGMPAMPDGRGDFLPKATALAIDQLSHNENGFFLMVEGSQIDWAGHANNPIYLVDEMLDFEKTIQVALDFAEKDGNTLVVVTADHETGGVALSPKRDPVTGSEDYNVIEPSFATGGHTATLIPVFAYGPGAEEFKGIYENTALFDKMVRLASWSNTPQALED
ncbi:MAG: alkaline phosphatase [Bacteroidales bacterium]